MIKTRKVFIGTLGILISMGCVVAAPIWDDKSISDADLLLSETVPLAAEQNIHAALPTSATLTEVERDLLTKIPVYENGQFIQSGATLKKAELLQVIAGSKNLVATFEKAAARSAYQCPITFMQYGLENGSCENGLVLNMSRVVIVHAAHLAEQGQFEKSAALVQAVLQVGYQMVVQERPGPAVEYIVGTAILDTALEFVIQQPKVKQYLPKLSATYTIDASAMQAVLRREYMHVKALMQLGFKNRTHTWYWFQPNQTIREYGDFVRTDMQLAATPCDGVVDTTAGEKQYQHMQISVDEISNLVRPNLIGRAMVSLAVVGLAEGLREQTCAVNRALTE